MTQINSPFLIKKLRPRRELLEKLGGETGAALNNYLDQIERYLEQSYRRLGGSNDSVSLLEDYIESNSVDIDVTKVLNSHHPEDDHSGMMSLIHERKQDPIDTTFMLMARIAKLEKKISDLEAQI
ncbi:MAG: hypothetical protein ACN2B6_00815 [Rickettsiales bacterium]